MNTTIAATATAIGKGAIAVIRVSGPKSKGVFKNLTKKKQNPTPNEIKPYWIYDGHERIDQSMIVFFASPHSFTGEDMLEIHCHGSQVVQQQILKLLFSLGVKPAKPGEFSERAYYNGKIDIAQAEAIMELVSAENSQVAKLATRQLAGEFSSQINSVRDDLTKLSASLAADLDFSEEDTPSVSPQSIDRTLTTALIKLQNIKAQSELLPKLHNGIHVALVGLPNAGKSTLLNRLLGYERSIVTEIAGTTRDTVSETIEFEGINYHFTDTAGLNNNPDKVEKIGIKRTYEIIYSADVVLLLIQPGQEKATDSYLKKNEVLNSIDKAKIIRVYTKSDILETPSKGLSISAKKGVGINKLLTKIKAISKAELVGDINLLTQRQVDILNKAELELVSIQNCLGNLSSDIVSAELESVISSLNELTGKQANQQIIDSIFRNFCIGK